MTVDDPETKAEVEALFADYQRALVSNDVAALDRFFVESEGAIRYGAGENLYGYGAIKTFRAARPAVGLARKLEKTRIVTYGRDLASPASGPEIRIPIGSIALSWQERGVCADHYTIRIMPLPSQRSPAPRPVSPRWSA